MGGGTGRKISKYSIATKNNKGRMILGGGYRAAGLNEKDGASWVSKRTARWGKSRNDSPLRGVPLLELVTWKTPNMEGRRMRKG